MKCDDNPNPRDSEFPPHASAWPELTDPARELSRRHFLKLMGASLALAGVTGGCSDRPEDQIVPYVDQPGQLVPGQPLYFATAMTIGGYARGLLVQSREGRPIKIEGNPDHPASLGGTDPFLQ